MNQKQLMVVFALVGLSLALIIILLVTGGAPSEAFDPIDAKDDVILEGESDPPEDLTLADVVEANVLADGTQITFEATMASEIPERIKGGVLEWRWEIIEGGSTTWIISANVDAGANAAILNQRTSYGASTIDDSLPGRLTVEGDTISISLEQQAMSGFPSNFSWTLATSLDADRTEAASAVAGDTAPDTGIGQFPPP